MAMHNVCYCSEQELMVSRQIRLRGGLPGSHYQWRSAGIQVDAGCSIIGSLSMIIREPV